MIKFLIGSVTFAAALAVSPTLAEIKLCMEVNLSFRCNNVGGDSGKSFCHKGENEASCCNRLKSETAHPRSGRCTGRKGGLRSFKCVCTVRATQGEFFDAPFRIDPREFPNDKAQSKGPILAPGVPHGSQPDHRPKGGITLRPQCQCEGVRIRYYCKNNHQDSASRKCGGREGEKGCCQRWLATLCGGAQNINHRRSDCNCVRWRNCKKQPHTGSGQPGRIGIRRVPRPAPTCREVKYEFQCRAGRGGSGKAACKGRESERKCCARVRRTVRETCSNAGGVTRFNCTCHKWIHRPRQRLDRR